MMILLKDKLRWPGSAFCTDRSLAGGAVTVGLGGDGKDVCLQPFISYRGQGPLSERLSDLISVGDYIQFDRAIADVPNRRMSILSVRFWLDKLVVLLMILTGNRKHIRSNIFDLSLQSNRNPGGKADFPFDQPLLLINANLRVVRLGGESVYRRKG
jgi:hypothetical protein